MTLAGIFPPISTPFVDGEVDVRGLRANAERWLKTGLEGLVALGSNGEAPYLDEAESDRVIETVRASVPRTRTFIVGTGRESTPATISASRRAAVLGADYVLVRTPGFFRSQMTADVLVRHYQTVADACPVPVLLYNFTAVTGIDLPVGAVIRLAEHPNIAGMKESNSDLAKVAALVDAAPSRFAIVVGSVPTLYASLCVGAVGAIVALANVVPELCVRLFDLVAAGRHRDALALQRQITPLGRLVTAVHGIAGLKAALDLAGFVGGPPRAPLMPAPPPAIDEIARALNQLLAADVAPVGGQPSV